MNYDFSIIIPHYNDEQNLRRCLSSIPQRDDLQIIVVDDNSDPTKVDYDHFPGMEDPRVSVIFSKGKEGKGPGFARNKGMEMAVGKWILFSDSDDYFTPKLNEALDLYKDDDSDIVFFKANKQSEEGVVTPYAMVNDAIDEARCLGFGDAITYGVPCPWGKLIKKEFLLKNKIRYQQIIGGDDIFFSVKMAIALKKYILSDLTICCIVDRAGSLTRNNQWQIFYSYVRACCDAYKLMKPLAKEKMASLWTSAWWGFLWAENKWRALMATPRIFGAMGFISALRCLKKGLKVGAWDWKNREK